MPTTNEHLFAIAAIRASSAKQGTDGDSPEAQKEQIDQYALTRGIVIKKYFVFLESASKDQQPMQEAIDYCKDPKNNVQTLIIKSIDRFTRGGSYFYDFLKMQLDNCGVGLVDIYGVISDQKVNTLEHVGFEYKWSVFSPSKKTEMLEAERAKDEMRDIMSRMIGAEIRYTRMGYWMRRPPYGFLSEPLDTQNGKRMVLRPLPSESEFILKMYELKCRGLLNDHQIVDHINKLGFRTRIDVIRDKVDRTKVIAQKGGNKLNIKGMQRFLENPIYAGVNSEKWTNHKALKCKFEGLVSIETFNRANRGKIAISEVDGELTIFKRSVPEFQKKKRVINPDFPYKKVVMCSGCSKPLSGSASRGKLGKYYPAYHCARPGHYCRIPKKEFDATIERFVEAVQIQPEYVEALEKAVLKEWEKRQLIDRKDQNVIETRIQALRAEASMAMDKIKFLSSETTIKYMEEEIMKTEGEIAALTLQKQTEILEKPADMGVIMKYIKYFLKHLDYLLLKQIDPLKRANFFSVLFNKAPTYDELVFGTQNNGQITGLSEIFKMKTLPLGNLEGQEGLEPSTPCLRGRCSNQLSYWPSS